MNPLQLIYQYLKDHHPELAIRTWAWTIQVDYKNSPSMIILYEQNRVMIGIRRRSTIRKAYATSLRGFDITIVDLADPNSLSKISELINSELINSQT